MIHSWKLQQEFEILGQAFVKKTDNVSGIIFALSPQATRPIFNLKESIEGSERMLLEIQ